MPLDAVSRQIDPDSVQSWRLTKAAIFGLIAVAAVVWPIVDQRRAAAQQALTKTGASIQGTVRDMEVQRGGQVLRLSYGFVVNGTPYEIRDRKVGDFNGLQPKGPIAVWYDPADPGRCVTQNELTHARFGWTPLLYGAVIAVMMGLAAFQAKQVLQPKREEEET
jgi:hypothetical protein